MMNIIMFCLVSLSNISNKDQLLYGDGQKQSLVDRLSGQEGHLFGQLFE